METNFLNIANTFGAVLGGLAAAIGLSFVYFQLNASRKIAEADLVLRLEGEWIDHYMEYYKKFLAGGKWSIDGLGPIDSDEKVLIEEYLDFFVTLSVLVENKLLSLVIIDEMFAYRFFVAANNPHAKNVIESKKEYWPSLYRLHKSWTKYRQQRNFIIANKDHDFITGC
ncbi:MAG: hypothetical protein D3906_01150 [Candidatus Electrothrix sp. AUS1_2]|nr:hypothetical protein [Candidatus Electrothrix sp. AUS1_2]